MNDEYVDRDDIPLSSREAYILFYKRDTGEGLKGAIHVPTASSSNSTSTSGLESKPKPTTLGPAMNFVPPKVLAEKRKRTIAQDTDDAEEDVGIKISIPSLSPSSRHLSPPPAKRSKTEAQAPSTSTTTPPALQSTSTSAAVQSALDALAEYAGDSSEAGDDVQGVETVKEDDEGKKMEEEEEEYGPRTPPPDDPIYILPASAHTRTDAIPDLFPPSTLTAPMDVDRTAPETSAKLNTIPPARFYGNKDKDKDREGSSAKKRRHSDENDRGGRKYSGSGYDHRDRRQGQGQGRDRDRKRHHHSSGSGNPLSGAVLTSNNLFEHRGGGGWSGGGHGSTRDKMNKRKSR